MIRNLRFCLSFFAIAAISLIATLHAHGATVQAASCQQSDVNAVINGPTHVAANGDTIQIPAGTCTWTSGINIPSGIGITIVGSGTPNSTPDTTGAATGSTIIVDDIPTSSNPKEVFVAAPTYGNATMRISMLEIEPQSGASPYSPLAFWSTCTSSGCANIRVDNITFPSSWYGDSSLQDGALLLANNSWGVLDHNTVTGVDGPGILGFANFSDGNWLGVGQYGDNSWAQPDTFGTQEAIYLENNLLNTNVGAVDCDTSDLYGDTGGCRYVARFNQYNDPSGGLTFSNHGTETTGRPRGGRQGEVYNNTFDCMNTSNGCGAVGGGRSGVWYVFDNSISINSGSWINNYMTLDDYRILAGFSPWGFCDGQSPYDQNDGTTYYSGTITGVSTTGGTLTVTVSGTPWTASQWVNSGDPYSLVDTSNTTLDPSGATTVGNPGWEITANTASTLSASSYSADYWNPSKEGPPTISVGDTVKILRARYCIDQPSRSGGTYLSGATPPTGSVNEVLDPSYEWGDTATNAPGKGRVSANTAKLIANRDFYSQVSSFNGTSGVGVGTLSARPSTCTVGVAYWATDQGNWNQSGSGGQGELFRCTATNTWSLAYTPYTYPHPLISGTSPVGPSPASGLTGSLQ